DRSWQFQEDPIDDYRARRLRQFCPNHSGPMICREISPPRVARSKHPAKTKFKNKQHKADKEENTFTQVCLEVYVLPDRPETSPSETADRSAGNLCGRATEESIESPTAAPGAFTDHWRGQMKHPRLNEQTPLAAFVQNRLIELGMKQSEFCRLTGF